MLRKFNSHVIVMNVNVKLTTLRDLKFSRMQIKFVKIIIENIVFENF